VSKTLLPACNEAFERTIYFIPVIDATFDKVIVFFFFFFLRFKKLKLGVLDCR